MAPAPPAPSQHRNGKLAWVRTVDVPETTPALSPPGSGGSKAYPDDVPRNRRDRRARAAKARRRR